MIVDNPELKYSVIQGSSSIIDHFF